MNTRNRSATSTKKRLRTFVIRVSIAMVCLGLGAVAGLAAVFYYMSLDLPAIGPLLKGYDPPQTTRILAQDGSLIGELFIERRTVVPLDGMPPRLIDAVISAEDADFRRHTGIDYFGIARAILRNVTKGELAQGASTITQQVARTFFLSREKSFTRKIREMLLTRRIEGDLTKDEILFLYLNQINFGHARYGVAEAARYYFDKNVKELTISEAALLAGIPKGPAVYEPIGHPEAALSRRSYVIDMMQRNGCISAAEAELAKDAPLGLKESPRNRVTLVPEAMSRVEEELATFVGIDELRRGGYTVVTSLSLDLQQAARDALVVGLMQIDKRRTRIAPFKKRRWPDGDRGTGVLAMGKTYVAEVTGHDDGAGILVLNLGGRTGHVTVAKERRYNPEQLPPSKMAEVGAKLLVRLDDAPKDGTPLSLRLAVGPQGAVVVLSPQTGDVLAMVSGDEVSPGGFNRASRALRQPGSAFKPFVYLEALRSRRYTTATLLDDSPEVEGDWKPENAHGADGHLGRVTMRHALAHSLNLPSVKLIRDITPRKVAELARLLGISSPMSETSSLALGASGVTPLELAAAYSTLAAGGVRRGPWLVKKVVNRHGRELPLAGRIGTPVIAPEEAFLITSLMRSVVSEGTGKEALTLKMPLAGKTGTTDDAKDAWFAGYSTRIAAVVWVGYDEPRPIGKREYGAVAALPVWVEVMRLAHGKTVPEEFVPPPGVVTALIDPASGLLAWDGMENPVEEYFIEGTEPEEQALPPEVVTLENFMVQQAQEVDSDSEPEPAPELTGDTDG